MESKYIIGIYLIIIFLFFWLIPKTNFSKKLKVSESFFIFINIVGIICGLLGLVVTFIYPQYIMAEHYYELILIPVFTLYMYTALVGRIQKSKEIYDEKQNLDMTRAAAFALPVTVVVMFLLFAFSDEISMINIIWFPVYIFFTIMVFSLTTLVLFKQD